MCVIHTEMESIDLKLYRNNYALQSKSETLNLTIASVEKSMMMQSTAGVYMVCVGYWRCLKVIVTTLVLERDNT